MLEWCALDPVDEWEMGRNDVVEDIQGNRNVFIDYPEYAWLLFDKEIPDEMTTPSGEAIAGVSLISDPKALSATMLHVKYPIIKTTIITTENTDETVTTPEQNETDVENETNIQEPTSTEPTVKPETTDKVSTEETKEPEKEVVTAPIPEEKPTTTNHTPTEIELEVLRLINIEREKAGVGKLTYNGAIYDCGVIRANECLITWSHTRPNGEKYWTVFTECGKTITTCCGENLAKNFISAEQVVEFLMNSEGHRNNILYKDFTSVCITILKDDDGYFYMSQLFMHPVLRSLRSVMP